MATTVTINTNFVGEVAGEYIGQMIREANTLSENLVTVLPNITSPQFIRKIETDQGFVDYVCGFTPAGSITLSEKELAPKKIKEDREICKEDFRQLWTAAQMGFSAHNDNLPQTEQAAILEDIGKRLALKIDREIWQGDGSDGQLNGFIPALESDADVIDVATPVAITAENVEDELTKFIAAHTDEMLDAEGHIFGVSTNVIRAIKRAYGTQARNNGVFLSPNEFDFNGYKLTAIKGLPANTMVGYNRNNLFFGTGLLSDHNEIKVQDMDEVGLLTGQIRMKTVLTGGVQYAWGGEVVLYKAV